MGEEHVLGLDAFAAAVGDVQGEIVGEDVITAGEAEFLGGAINGVGRAFELDEIADGSFVKLDQEPRGPGFGGWELIGGAEFFVAKPAAHAEAFKNFGEVGRIGDLSFYFFADFMGTVDGTWISSAVVHGGTLEGEDLAARRGSGGFFAGTARRRAFFSCGLFNGSSALEGCGFSAEAEKLTVFRETAVGGIKN